MKRSRPYPINDISDCVNQARRLLQDVHDTYQNDQALRQVFASLADDELTGFLAFVIWRGRAWFLSSLITSAQFGYDGHAGSRSAREPVARGSV